MNNNNQEFVNTLLKRLVKLNYIKPGDVPRPLYGSGDNIYG